MNAYEALTTRATPIELGDPAPDQTAEARIMEAAIRAPDHGRLRPWRFLTIRGEDRARFGELMAATLARKEPKTPEERLDRERRKAFAAPLIIVVAARIAAHPKIPTVEQLLSAGAAAQNMILACHALGFGAMWKTGEAAYDPGVKDALGLAASDEIVGFIYIGTPKAMPQSPASLNAADFVRKWP